MIYNNRIKIKEDENEKARDWRKNDFVLYSCDCRKCIDMWQHYLHEDTESIERKYAADK